MKNNLTLVVAGLTTPPGAPLKGRGHSRVEWFYRNVGLAKAAFEAVPAAHKATLAVRSNKGGFFSTARVISPEAAHALKELAALLKAKGQLEAIKKRDEAKQAATLAAALGQTRDALCSFNQRQTSAIYHIGGEAIHAADTALFEARNALNP